MRQIAGLLMFVVLLSLAVGIVSAQETPCHAELEVMTTDDGVEFVRTPDACFENLPDWPYAPQYVEIDGLRQAYVDVGSGESGETILLLHGQPSWSYLYRKMIPVLADAGHRVIAMDHVGLGRSDKPIDPDYYTFLGHTDRLESFIQALELEQGNLTIFVQDWGSLIGLYVIGIHPDWFDRVIVGNGALPTFEEGTIPYELPQNPLVTRQLFFTTITSVPAQQPEFYDADGNLLRSAPTSAAEGTFGIWIDYARNDERFAPSQLLEAMTYFDLTDAELAAYDAPFPSRIAMGGPRAFPGIVNQLPGVTDVAWEGLGKFDKPFLTIWGGNDPGNLGLPKTQQTLLDHVPGAAGWDHVRLPQASHFLQDDQGEEIARRVHEFITLTTTPNESVSLLDYHNGYWVTEMDVENLAVPITLINDMWVDAATNSVTVYAQSRLLTQIVAPPQVNPGECTETPMGDTVCFHPDAVYLNGSGKELMEADGTGSWWVKHAWILGGEGYINCELRAQAEYNDCLYAEGVLLDDGLSMKVGAVEEGMEGFFNIRTPLLDEDPILYRVTRYEPANLDADAGAIDLTPTARWALTWRCGEEPSALNNQVRRCPVIND